MVEYKSINQSKNSLEEREQYFFNNLLKQDDKLPKVLIQTCNRMEVYYGKGTIEESTIRHLFRVCAGLESALIGERAVQGQIRNAYEDACKKYHLPGSIHKLFQAALFVGKRVRNETCISQGAVSHSLAAIELMKQENIDFSHAFISIIGVNKLTEDMLRFLKNKGAILIFLGNRSLEKAKTLAAKVDTEIGTFSLSEKQHFFDISDVIISATSAPHYIIHEKEVTGQRKQLYIDMAFPRDIEPAIGEKENVTLYNLSDVEKRISQNFQLRNECIKKAEYIIEEEIKNLRISLHKMEEIQRNHAIGVQ